MARLSPLQRLLPSPLMRASAVGHVCALTALLAQPAWWPYALGAIAADHLLLTGCGLWPRSTALGPNWIRLPLAAAGRGVALTFDDGPDPAVTPQVLDALDEHRVKATFFCVGARVARHADLCREIVHRGHAIENHSYRHCQHFSLLGPAALARDIARAQETIADVCGTRPVFFRAPAGLRSPLLQPILSRLDLILAAWTRRGFDTVNGRADSVFARLTRGLEAGDILLLHDGHPAVTARGTPVVVEVLPRLLRTLAARQLSCIRLRDVL